MGVESWSSTAASNNSAPPDGWPEGMSPSAVNDTGRKVQASVRAFLEDGGWFNYGHTHAYVSATSSKVSGVDYSAIYTVGRRVRAVGSTTGTIYGRIATVAFSTDTTMTYQWDATGALSNESLTVSVSLVGANQPFGADLVGALNTAKATAVASAATTDIWAANGNLVHVTGTTAITSLGTSPIAGAWRFVIFDGALTVTHDGTAVVVEGGLSWTTTAGGAAWVFADTTTKALVYPLSPVKQSFSAHKNGTDQTGVTSTTEIKVTFTTEVFDVGSAYTAADSKWTPAAGKVLINAAVLMTNNIVDQQISFIVLYKNGSAFKRGGHAQQNGVSVGPMLSVIDDANGTDYYEVYAYAEGAGDKTISGVAIVTYFMGSHL